MEPTLVDTGPVAAPIVRLIEPLAAVVAELVAAPCGVGAPSTAAGREEFGAAEVGTMASVTVVTGGVTGAAAVVFVTPPTEEETAARLVTGPAEGVLPEAGAAAGAALPGVLELVVDATGLAVDATGLAAGVAVDATGPAAGVAVDATELVTAVTGPTRLGVSDSPDGVLADATP